MAQRLKRGEMFTPFEPKAAWLDHFAQRLGELIPTMDAEMASSYALTSFAVYAHLPPRHAANFFALEFPWRSVST